MDANKIYDVLKKEGYDVTLNDHFDFRIDKDRSFKIVTLRGKVSTEVIAIVTGLGGMLVAHAYFCIYKGLPVREVRWDVYPSDGRSFDWV